ncbi:spore germination protein [Desulforamulus ruminis]|nr:spore germination protein [Desulforamulus ruminis]
MNIWQNIRKIFQFESDDEREGFVLKETPREKKEAPQVGGQSGSEGDKKNSSATEGSLCSRQEGTENRGKRKKPVKVSRLQENRSSGKEAADEDGQNPPEKEGHWKKPLSLSWAQKHHNPDQVSSNLDYNKERIEEIYHLPLNKDFIIREFTVALEPPVKAFAVFMEGLSDKNLIDNQVLQPMMLFSNFHEQVDGFLLEHIQNRVLTGNQVTPHKEYEQIIGGINYGSTAVFIEGCDQALVVETKGWEHRAVDRPANETVIRGPQEAFGETLRTNTGLVRKYIRSSKLTTEMMKLGDVAQSDVAIMYLRGVANESLIREVKRRIQSIKIDAVIDSGILEQLIEDQPWNIAPQVMATERPDRVAFMLMRGKVAIFMDSNPYVLIVPVTMFDHLHTQEDYYLRPFYGSFLRLVRTLAFYVSFLTPGVYLATVLFHKEMIPTELLLAISGARERVPFPSVIEVIIMEGSFELIREAGVRVPGVMGATIGIVGALILGQAAVQANIVSPILVIVVAVTGLASFAIPSYSLQFSLRIIRFGYIVLGTMMGFVGIVFGLFVQMHMMASLKSFGVPYLAPMAPTTKSGGDVVVRIPAFSWERRPDYLNTKDDRLQGNIARGWIRKSTRKKK